jgi:anti-sigma factor RsiW
MNQTHPSTERIIDYLHGELPAPEDAAIHAHLADCPSCEYRRAEELTITEVLRAHAQANERELPASVVAKIHEAIERRPSPARNPFRVAFRPVFFLPAAAAIVIALYFGFGLRHSAPTVTAVNPDYYVGAHAAVAATAPFAEDAVPPTVLASDYETR